MPVKDLEAAARRAAQRRERVAGGLAELEVWLGDQLTAGLAQLAAQGARPWEQLAARMVDAQAPGVASMLRGAPALLGGEDWPQRLLDRMAALHLLAGAHARLAELPDDLAATVRTRIGYPVSKADVLALPPVHDTWAVLGAVIEDDGYLQTRRTWLYGERSGHFVIELSFAPELRTLPDFVPPGGALTAPAHRYPGSGQFRALFPEVPEPSARLQHAPSPVSLGAVAARYAALLADDPWSSRVPAAVLGVPVRTDDGWVLVDADQVACRVLVANQELWPLLAVSRGRPISLFGEWSPAGLAALSVLPHGEQTHFIHRIAA